MHIKNTNIVFEPVNKSYAFSHNESTVSNAVLNLSHRLTSANGSAETIRKWQLQSRRTAKLQRNNLAEANEPEHFF